MTIQTGNLGTAPSGAGGDTFRSFATKMNENFTNNTHAASRLIGTAAGNVMEVGAFGLGGLSTSTSQPNNLIYNGLYHSGFENGMNYCAFIHINHSNDSRYSWQIGVPMGNINLATLQARIKSGDVWSSEAIIRNSHNTTIDSNGFIKAASPVVQLFADKIAANDEALEQEPTFEKVDVGHYLIKNTEGFSDDGWYIEMPKDANGNVLVAVQYQQLEDNTIEVKTFAKKFDEETGDIVPNLEKPRDIPTGRWIDIRLKALPQPEIEISKTPVDFQPTNLAQAVAEALKDDSE